MKFIDLSQPVFPGCPNYPANPRVRSKRLATHRKDAWQVELLTLTCHTGSHLDAPRHKLPDGAAIDELPLETFAGPALIADLRDSQPNQPLLSGRLRRVLLTHELAGRIVLLVTGWGQKRARSREWLRQPPFLAPEAARWLVKQGVRGVGIDHHSIGGVCEPFNSHTHRILLKAGVWVAEDLRFPDEVFALPQPVQFMALPVNLKGHSGAFCRPVILTEDAPVPARGRRAARAAQARSRSTPARPPRPK